MTEWKSDIKFLFGKRIIKTKVIGKIFKEQMVLKRFSPICENCNSNSYYNISCTYYIKTPVIPIYEKKYEIKCPECGETIELDYEEYLKINSIIKLNNKYEKGKINKEKYELVQNKILNRL